MLSEKDRKLLQKAINEKDKYKIVVDNDFIIVDEKEDIGEYESFDNYGADFIVDILQYLGIDAEYC